MYNINPLQTFQLNAFIVFLVFFINICVPAIFRYELAAECADDDDDKLAISDLRKSVMEELKMHNSFVQVKHRGLSCLHAHVFHNNQK